MQPNWPIVIAVIIFAIILLVLIIRQNRKDEKDLTEQLNDDYKRADDELDDDL